MSDRGLLSAFDKGHGAANADKPRSANPYRPSSEQDYYEAWNCGFDEAAPRYTAAIADPFPQRRGKSMHMATLAAAALRDGKTVGLARIGEDGKVIVEHVVGVPGFPDGRQLPAPRRD